MATNQSPALIAPPAVGRLLTHAAGRAQRLGQLYLDDVGAKLAQWALLFALSHRGHATQAELAAFTDRTEAAVSLTLSEMEGAGLVRRKTNPRNRRQTRVSTTAKGRAQFGKAKDMWRAVNQVAFTGLTAREIDEVYRLLGRIIDNLDRELAARSSLQPRARDARRAAQLG